MTAAALLGCRSTEVPRDSARSPAAGGSGIAPARGSARRASISLGKGQLLSGKLVIPAARTFKLSLMLPARSHRLLAQYSGHCNLLGKWFVQVSLMEYETVFF